MYFVLLYSHAQGFDLLNANHDSKKLEDLPKVSLKEDEDGNIHLRCSFDRGSCTSLLERA